MMLWCAAAAVFLVGGARAAATAAPAATRVACGACEFEDNAEYAGGDLLPADYKQPPWWTPSLGGGAWGGMDGLAIKLESQEACCTFCREWNRRALTPPCDVATFTLAPADTRKLCFPKGPSHQPKAPPGTAPRVACTPSPAGCAAAGWGGDVVVSLLLGVGLYVGVGVGLGSRRRGQQGLGLASHPHHRAWLEVRGLVSDGVRLAGARMTGQRLQPARSGGAGGLERPLVTDRQHVGNAGRQQEKRSSKQESGKDQRSRQKKTWDGGARDSDDGRSVGQPVAEAGGGRGSAAAASAAGSKPKVTQTASAGGGKWVHVPD